MEPCWIAMGQAAGTVAAMAAKEGVAPRAVDVRKVQETLLDQNAMLIYFRDLRPGDPHYKAAQMLGVRGVMARDTWEAKLDKPVTAEDAAAWISASGVEKSIRFTPGKTTRGELLEMLYETMK